MEPNPTSKPMGAHRVGADVAAIISWLGVWLISLVVTAGVVMWALLTPDERAIYVFPVVVQGIPFIALVGLACSTFFLWVKRRVRLFLVCAVPVGIATALWPFLLGAND